MNAHPLALPATPKRPLSHVLVLVLVLVSALPLCFGCDANVTTIGRWSASADAAHDAGRTGRDGGRDAEDSGPPDAAPSSGQYLEAEDGELSGGFAVDSDARASQGAALLAPEDTPPEADQAPGPARARYAFELDGAGDYAIWGRIHALGSEDNRFWFQLDGGDWIKWRISTGEVWYWDDFHRDAEYGRGLRFPLAAGPHQLLIANAVAGTRLDRLYITAGDDEPPGNDTRCRPPHTIEVAGECRPSCGLLSGTRCGPVDCAGLAALPAYDCDVCCRVE